MPAAKSTCSHCILDGTPLSFDRAAKLEHHCQQKHHKIVQQAYERGLQEGCNSPLVESMIQTQLQPVSVEMPPQNAVETETAYAHGFQDGKAAEKAVHETVIKAILDSHKIDLEAAFKRGKEHSIVTAASQTLQLLPTQVGRLQSDLQQEPYAQGVAAPQPQPALENTAKDSQPPAEQSQSNTSICSGSDNFDKPGDTNAYSAETYTQNTCNLAEAAGPPPLTGQLSIQHQNQVQIQLEQQPAPGLTLPQASSEADLEHHMCEPMLSTELGPAPFCSLEQMRSLKKCSRAVDIHDSNFDPCKAKLLTMQLAKCLPNLAPRQPKVQIDSKTLSKTSTSCRAKTRKNAAC